MFSIYICIYIIFFFIISSYYHFIKFKIAKTESKYHNNYFLYQLLLSINIIILEIKKK